MSSLKALASGYISDALTCTPKRAPYSVPFSIRVFMSAAPPARVLMSP